MAPEVLLSRLAAAGVDIDAELKSMLSGGFPNAVHQMAVEVLRRSEPAWTTNFDELVEAAALAVDVPVHVMLPSDDATCRCGCGHLVKVHGTLSAARVFARSEDVLRPLPAPLMARLAADLTDASVAIIGYAGADIDLRSGLRDALSMTRHASWFCRPDDETALRRRFQRPLASSRLSLKATDRPEPRRSCLGGEEWPHLRDLPRLSQTRPSADRVCYAESGLHTKRTRTSSSPRRLRSRAHSPSPLRKSGLARS
jgi:hypothetical protein